MKKILYPAWILLSLTSPLIAQVHFTFAPELGFASSRLPEFYRSMDNGNITWERSPVKSPLAGGAFNLQVKKHLLLSMGLQYQATGEHLHYHGEWNSANSTDIQDTRTDQVFHKLSLPVSAGLIFGKKALRFSVQAGYRPNFFFAAHYYSAGEYNSSNDTLDMTVTTSFDPYNSPECEMPPKRLVHQFYAGASVWYRQLELASSFNRGYMVYYSQYKPGPLDCFGPSYSFYNSDITVSLKYHITLKKKKTCDCPH
jgi:hypothetical protein